MIGYLNSVKLFFLVGLAATSVAIQLLFNKAVPFPFIDEKFHFDQLHNYCDGNFTYWNAKITTPPGLYVLSLAYVRGLSLLFGSDSCSLPTVRFFNVIATLLLFNVSYAVTKDVSLTRFRRALNALNCTIFPIFYFSTFLYYTDCCSLLLLSCCYVMAKAKQPMYSALFALLSVCVRQSNVVWVVFTAAIYFLESFEGYVKQQRFSYYDGKWSNLLISKLFWHDVILPELNYALVVLLFLSFAYMNGGFALGDRQAHQVCLHISQLFYCVAVILLLGWPVLLSRSRVLSFAKSLYANKALYALVILLMTVCIRSFTFVHPYLLADNRHLTFYIWRRWFAVHYLCRFLFIPVYIFAFYCITCKLRRYGAMWKSVFWICLAACCIPNRLLEMRYFIVPFYTWRIHCPTPRTNKLVLEFFFHALINAALLLIFLLKTFRWADELEPQRIIL
ncbi:hypothetical protein M514_02146, partial [Trichuris suis]